MNIDDAVELWHESPEDGMELHEFLGMNWDDYATWVETGYLPQGWKFPKDREGS